MRVEMERAMRPFWMHQVVEYLIGVVLIAAALQTPTPTLPAVMGIVVLINAAITKGAGSAFNLVGRRIHRWIDVAVMVTLAVAAFQPWVDVEATGRLILGGIAFVMFFVWFHTDFADTAGRKARRASRARPGSEEIGRRAGKMVGDGVNTVRRWQQKDD